MSDAQRPEDIELESRSTGLQWFFSFFLVFLVERRDAHRGAILLLDEPGLTLHPLSQKDLAAFFDDLSKTNPIIYTTHSPFMVDYDRVDRVRSVYVDTGGATVVSADLRASVPSSAAGRSVYLVHAALGLSVSEGLLQGCAPVIVEGSSDQHYLTAIKIALIARKKIAPKRDLLFAPAGGARGANTLAPILAAREDHLPIVLLDDDAPGRTAAKALRDGPIYSGQKERILNVKEFAGGIEQAEVEDLLRDQVIEAASRQYRGADDEFKDVAVGGAVVPQIEAYAKKNDLVLQHGWKVELARQVKQRLLRQIDTLPDALLDNWAKLFARFEG